MAVCQEFEIEIENEIIPRIAYGFAGGIGNTGAVCGALAGAEMTDISCRELTGADLSTDEGIEQFMSSDTPLTVCFPAVGLAYRLVVDVLKENS